MRQIKRIFVHCTAGPQNQSIETIKNYWKNVKKWANPGYHYIIKANGEIVPLQPEEKASNGVAGYNSTSINVCYIGGVDDKGRAVDNRTDYQKESLIYILRELKKKYPDAEIMGHRDIWGSDPKNWKKMCPCFDAKTEYANIGHEEESKEVEQPEQQVETSVTPTNIGEEQGPVEDGKTEVGTNKEGTTADRKTTTVQRGKTRKSLASYFFDALLTLFLNRRYK